MKRSSWRFLVTPYPAFSLRFPTREAHPEDRSGWLLSGDAPLSKKHYHQRHILHPSCPSGLFSHHVDLNRQVVVRGLVRLDDPAVRMELIPASSIFSPLPPPGLRELGCIPRTLQHHLQALQACRLAAGPRVPTRRYGCTVYLVPGRPGALQWLLSPGPTGTRTCPGQNTTRATGRKSRLPSGFDAKSRSIQPPNHRPPFRISAPLQETVFLLVSNLESGAKRAPAQTPCQSPVPSSIGCHGPEWALGRRAVLSSKWAHHAKARDEHGRRVSGDSPWEFPSQQLTVSHSLAAERTPGG